MEEDAMKTVRTKNGHLVEDFLDFVPVPEGRSGKVTVQFELKPRRVPIPTSNLRTSIYGGDPRDSVKYPRATTWRSLREEGVGTWMTDLPIEQYQLRHQMAPARQARSVLVGGLGLGIAARVALRARGIERVTVVERSKDVIALVEPTLERLPELEGPLAPRLEVVRADLFDYLKNTTDRFGWAFLDVWQSDSEDTFHRVVVPLRKVATSREVVPVGRVLCWNEHVMRGQLAQNLTTSLVFAGARDLPDVPETFRDQPSLQELAEPMDRIYCDWRIPFFRWMLAERPDAERARDRAVRYARAYEVDPGWLERWRAGA